MSVAQLQQSYRDVRARLRNPPNGRYSDEIEVVSEAKQRALRIEAERLAQAKAALEERRGLEKRKRELLEALAAVNARSNAVFAVEDGVKVITFDQITSAVCKHYQLPSFYVFGRRKAEPLVRPRWVIMYLARELTGMSFPSIGKRCGGRDHTTAMHGAKKISALLSAGEEWALADLAAIRKALGL